MKAAWDCEKGRQELEILQNFNFYKLFIAIAVNLFFFALLFLFLNKKNK